MSANRTWTEAEDEILRQDTAAGVDPAETGRKLQRVPSAIVRRARDKKLPRPAVVRVTPPPTSALYIHCKMMAARNAYYRARGAPFWWFQHEPIPVGCAPLPPLRSLMTQEQRAAFDAAQINA